MKFRIRQWRKLLRNVLKRSKKKLMTTNQVMNQTNACGATEKVFKHDDKKLRQCINGVSVRNVITLSIVRMIKLIQSTDGANIY